ncbi:hypothetical protein JOD03_001819 [Chryseomicrobium aureum]|nr:hypothetical protein [Chryseomicrobium aureum]
MSKSKFWILMFSGILTGFILSGILRWIDKGISLENIFQALLGDPSFISVTILIVATLLFCYVIIAGSYKNSVKVRR